MTLVLECDPDPSAWLAVPDSFEEWGGLEAWSEEAATLFVEDGADEPGAEVDERPGVDARRRDAMVAVLASVARASVSGTAVDRTYLFHAEPVLPPVMLDVAILPAVDDAVSRHRLLGRADAPGAVGAVQVSEVVNPHLGTGTTVLRFDEIRQGSSGRVVGTMRCFWRVGDRDVAVNIGAPRPDALLACLPSALTLVQSLRVADEQPD